jgi:hypothetical protein
VDRFAPLSPDFFVPDDPPAPPGVVVARPTDGTMARQERR